MKIRTDFVTNSSSSSFILAKKPGFNDKQKRALLDFIEQKMLGKAVLSPNDTEDKIKEELEDMYVNEDEEKDIKTALKEGKTIYTGTVDFECPDEDIADIYCEIWDILKENSDGDFTAIDDDLSY